MINALFNNLYILVLPFALLIAISIHEFSHALIADKLGDPTPRLADRLTLNPLAHLDPIGTALPILLILSRSSFVFGWGKPVPIDPYNFRNPRKDTALVSLAGPASNIILSLLLSLILKILPVSMLSFIIIPIISINVSLAIFNLIPVPPLDGAKILFGFLPVKWGVKLEESMSQYGIFLIIFLIFPFFGGASLVSRIIFPIIDFILNLLL